jgi:hypothetical protein
LTDEWYVKFTLPSKTPVTTQVQPTQPQTAETNEPEQKRVRFSPGEIVLLTAGIALRLWYVALVPFIVRCYDVHAHVDHIKFEMEHGALPDDAVGWENFQPPLYYTIAAIVGWFDKGYINGEDAQIIIWKRLACLFSIILLFCTVYVGRKLFTKRQEAQRLWFLATVTFFPSIVYATTRISNDPVYYIFAFLWAGTIIEFWLRPNRKTFIWLSIECGLGLLSKASMLAMTAVTFLFLSFCRRITIGQKALWAAIGMAIVLTLAGWFHIPRAMKTLPSANPNTFIIGNIVWEAEGLFYKSEWQNFCVFNPIRVVEHPNCNGWKVDPLRVYFWEYYFKSGYTGEFLEKEKEEDNEYRFARILLSLNMLLFPYMIFSFIRTARRPTRIAYPYVWIWPACMAAQIGYVYRVGLANVQDFRFFSFLLLVYAYFTVDGIYATKGWMRNFGKLILFALLFVSFAFVYYLVLYTNWIGV